MIPPPFIQQQLESKEWLHDDALPKVACVMPTMMKRRPIRGLSLECLAEQTYYNWRLIVDESNDYETLGDKYNELYNRAVNEGADYIALWSDDDWQHPDSLSVRMDALMRSGKERVGMRALHFANLYPEGAGRMFYVPCDRQPAHWVTHLSLIISANVWRNCEGYPSQQVGSDAAFQTKRLWRVPSEIVDQGPNDPLMIAMQYGRNTYNQDPRHHEWEKYKQTGRTLATYIGEEEASKWKLAASALY